MIYSWKVRNKWLDDEIKVAAEELKFYQNGFAALYIGDHVVAVFREWSSIQRLPSE